MQRRKKGQGYRRITIAVSEEAAQQIEACANEDRLSNSAVAGRWLEERAAMERVMDEGGSVTIEDTKGNVQKLPSRRLFKLNSS